MRSGSGRPTSAEQLEHAPAALGAGGARYAPRRSRRSGRPTGISGLSAAIGSWKIMPMRAAAHAAHRALGRASSRSRPSIPDACRPHGLTSRQQAHDRLRHHRLARAGFADDAQDLARRTSTARRRRRRAARSAQAGSATRQVLDARGAASLISVSAQPRVERVVEPFADEVDRQHGRAGWRAPERS